VGWAARTAASALLGHAARGRRPSTDPHPSLPSPYHNHIHSVVFPGLICEEQRGRGKRGCEAAAFLHGPSSYSHSSWFWTCCSGWPWPWRRMPRRCPRWQRLRRGGQRGQRPGACNSPWRGFRGVRGFWGGASRSRGRAGRAGAWCGLTTGEHARGFRLIRGASRPIHQSCPRTTLCADVMLVGSRNTFPAPAWSKQIKHRLSGVVPY
jgi:hypothetical protein